MKFTYNWLRQYIDFEWSPAELAEKLTFAGIEVEEVRALGGHPSFAQVVVAQVLASEKHPNADKLSVCRVTDGKVERQIVCGAKNYRVGDKIPLARPGTTLPNGLTIKPAKLRGVESNGMMCSAKELDLAEDAEGLLILPADTTVGITLGQALGGADTVFDIEVTPNRPDWLSVIGIAREVAALTGHPLRLPEFALAETGVPVAELASVRVDAPELCPRYAARVIQGVKIGPSPAWMQQTLERVGLRAINNVVDVTNYVLLETGHPLHAFDYGLVRGHQILVRRARNGEQYEAIDDSRHELTEEMLVIADAERAVALAGIMGGKNSEINEATTDVLLESAYFDPPTIRRTSKRLGLSSESSYRFERGTDIEGLVWAGNRAAALIHQLAGGQIAAGMLDALARPIGRRQVRCRYAEVNRLLGIEVPSQTVKRIFVGLGLSVVRDEPNDCAVEVPTFRVDLEREADLIEEVCRIHGVERIPARQQPATAVVSEFDAAWDRRRRVREIMTALGYHEALNQTFVTDGACRLENPLNAEQSALRPALAPGLLANLRTNVSRHERDVRLFEVGQVFSADGTESLHLALALTGRRDPQAWERAARNTRMDFYDLKGAVEELAAQLGVERLQIVAPAGSPAPAEPVATVLLADKPLGELRQVPAAAARKFDLRDPVCVGELDLAALLAGVRSEGQFRELPRFPSVVRDVALLVDEAVGHADVLAALQGFQNKFLERVELFDIFWGGSLAAGRKSMAYSCTYRAPDRTLTDAEVNEAHLKLKQQLQQALSCEIRES